MTHMLISIIIIATLAISLAASWNAETASVLRPEIAEKLSVDVSSLPPAQQSVFAV